MGERENKVKGIIKRYEEDQERINKKYEAKSQKKYDNTETKKEVEKIQQELKPMDDEIEFLKRGLENVKEEEPNNEKLILQYEKQIKALEQDEKRQKLLKDKQEILEKSLAEKNRIEQENKEIDLENKKNESKNKDIKQKELRESEDKVRRELTKESIAIEDDIKKLEIDMQVTLSEMHNFKPEYKEGTRICINGEELKKLDEKYKEQQDLKEDLKKAKNLCNSKLKEFKDRDSKRVEKINEILKNKNGNTQQDKGQNKDQDQDKGQNKDQDQDKGQNKDQDQDKGQNKDQDQDKGQSKDQDQDKDETEDKDTVTSININAAEGKAYIGTLEKEDKEIDIKDAIEEKKGLFKRLDINGTIDKLGVESKIKQFMIRRKINPIILKAIQEDEELTEQYIESIIDNKKFPFKYTHNLENSSLSNKDTNFMNRLALKEAKIEGNEVKGAEKLRAIKNIFRGMKNRAQKRFEKKEEPKQIAEGKKEKLSEILQKQMQEQEKKYEEAYNDLSDEQKNNLQNMNVSDLQRLGMEYTTACGVFDKYVKNNTAENKETENKEVKNKETESAEEEVTI